MNSKFTTKALRTHRSTKFRMLTLQVRKTHPFPSPPGKGISSFLWNGELFPEFQKHEKPAQLANSFLTTCHLD